jgi:hypothetical protein
LGQELLTEVLVGCSPRRVQFDRNIQPAKMAIERRADDTPLQSTVVAAESRSGQGLDAPGAVMALEVLQPGHDVGQSGNGPPVALGREVQDQRGMQAAKQIGLTEPHLLCCATRHVVLIHLWEALFELKR